MQERTRLKWRSVERIAHLPDLPVYEARVPGGIYRVGPVEYVDSRGPYSLPLSSEHGRLLCYEVFFIPTGATSAADGRDIAEGLARAEQAKAIAQRDFDANWRRET
jgi:hypothetical protein